MTPHGRPLHKGGFQEKKVQGDFGNASGLVQMQEVQPVSAPASGSVFSAVMEKRRFEHGCGRGRDEDAAR
jgi:hypothetical protein